MQALKTIPRGFVVASASGAATGLVLARRVIATRRAEEARVGTAGGGGAYSLSGSSLQAPPRATTVTRAGGGTGEMAGERGAKIVALGRGPLAVSRGERELATARPPTPRPHPFFISLPSIPSLHTAPPTTTTLKVEGMVCSKCTARVEKALIDAGMEVAKADLSTGLVSVSGPGADAAALAALVTGIGFPAVPGE